jgi:uncharacterized delta-60 repeat protein
VKARQLNRTPGSSRHACLLVGVLVAALLSASAAISVASTQSESLDRSFGEDGVSLTRPSGIVGGEAALALTRDRRGRLVIAGTTESEKMLVRRFHRNGAPDLSFSRNGKVETSLGGTTGQAVTMASGGDILVAGGTDGGLALVRYRSDGSPVRSFGHNGHIVVPGSLEGASALTVDIGRGGRIFSGGYKIDLAHDWTAMVIGYRPDGSLDPGFGRQGIVEFQAPHRLSAAISGIEVLPDGKILAGGDLGGSLLLARLLPNGRLDRGFGGGDGIVLVDADGARNCTCTFANSLTLTPDGKPLLAGVTSGSRRETSLLVRFTPDGRLDPRFGRHGVVRTLRGSRLVFNDATVQRDGRITAAGFFNSRRTGEGHLAVLRYLPNGKLDHSFATGGFFHRHLGRESVASAAITQPDGRVVVAGRAAFGPLAFDVKDHENSPLSITEFPHPLRPPPVAL